ncbi:MAG: hypothetical protein ACMUIG_08430 [Thermoplasmatota archaeon]
MGIRRLVRSSVPERMRPLTASIIALVIGIAVLRISMDPDLNPINGSDLDGDSVSDMYQETNPLIEVTIDGSGDPVEERVGYESSPDLPVIVFTASLFLVLIPAAAYLYFWNIPRRRDERWRSRKAGIMHDSVRRMASFLEVNPSLFYSIKCTIASQEEADRQVLNALLWESRCGGRPFRVVYDDFTDRCGRDDPLIGKTLKDLASAEGEASREEVRKSARRAIDELTEDAGRKMAEYVESLKTPSTALFALGVLLPVLLSTMIPLAGIETSTTWMLGFLLWVVIPGGIILFGNSLVRRRPMFGNQSDYVKGVNMIRRLPGIGLAFAGLILFAITLALATEGAGPEVSPPLMTIEEFRVLLLIDSAALTAAGAVWAFTAGYSGSINAGKELDREIPGFLNSLGTSILEGSSFEGAVRKAASNSREPIRGFRNRLSDPSGLSASMEGLPPGLNGVLSAAYHFSRTGSEAGGQAVRALSSHLRGMNNLDSEMSRKIQGAVGQMEVTASILAPLMIGGSVSIFHLLESTVMPGDGSMALMGVPASSSISGPAFMILTGGYLLLLSVATAVTLFRLRNGRDSGGWHRVPARIIQSAAAYTAGVVLSVLVIG